MRVTKRVLIFLTLLRRNGIILKFNLVTDTRQGHCTFARVYLTYYRNLPLFRTVKVISTPSRTFYTSLQSLKLLDKRINSTVFILATSKGLLTHKEAILLKTGGVAIALFSI